MSAAVSERMNKLQSMLEKQPNDTFLLYGLAMEYKKANQLPQAIEFFNKVLALDPGYCYAYHQRGLAYEMSGNLDAAKASYREGMAAAEKKGDAHARDEIEAALQILE